MLRSMGLHRSLELDEYVPLCRFRWHEVDGDADRKTRSEPVSNKEAVLTMGGAGRGDVSLSNPLRRVRFRRSMATRWSSWSRGGLVGNSLSIEEMKRPKGREVVASELVSLFMALSSFRIFQAIRRQCLAWKSKRARVLSSNQSRQK